MGFAKQRPFVNRFFMQTPLVAPKNAPLNTFINNKVNNT